MFDDLTVSAVRSTRRHKRATIQPSPRDVAPLWTEESAGNEPLVTQPKAAFWDTVTIVAFTCAVFVGAVIGVPLGVYFYRAL